jgi:hypothetical protein
LVKELARLKKFRRFASGKKEDREAGRNRIGALAGFVVSQRSRAGYNIFCAEVKELVVKENKKLQT